MKLGYWTILLSLLAQGAAAQTCQTLSYTGAPFTAVVASDNNKTITIHGPVVGTVTLQSPLPPNAVNLGVLATTWTFSGNPELSSGDPFFAQPEYVDQSFAFSTDANGNVSAGVVAINWNNDPGAADHTTLAIAITQNGDTVAAATDTSTITGTSTVPGTWTCLQPFTSNYTAPPPPPPPVDPLIAQVAALTAQVAALTAEVNGLIAERNVAEAQVKTLTKELAAANATIVADNKTIALLRAEIIALKKSRR